jgi:hypothetical protein
MEDVHDDAHVATMEPSSGASLAPAAAASGESNDPIEIDPVPAASPHIHNASLSAAPSPLSLPHIRSLASSVDSEADEHLECCLVCGGIGELLLCDTCPMVYHVKCVGLKRIPEGLWSCDVCLGRATVDQYRERRQEARRARANQQAARHTRSGGRMLSPLPEQSDEAMSEPDIELESEGVACAFCRKVEPSFSSGYQPASASDPRYYEERMAGPFTDERGEEIYVHRACAMWSPQVFIKGRELQNVVVEVQRARWLSCAECGKRGASIGCCERSCPKSFHYPCAVQAQCCMQLPAYTVHCSDHAIAVNLPQKQLLEPPLLQLRLTNSQQVLTNTEPTNLTHAPIGNKNRAHDGFYSSVEAYEKFLARETAALAKKQARFAHLAHLLYDERKRTIRAELRIKTLSEEQREHAKLAKKCKRKHAMVIGHEDPEQKRRKLEEDSKAIEVMNGAPAAAGTSSDSISPSTAPPDSWSMIGGLSAQMESLKECVLLPMLYPELFTQLHIRAPRGMLLLGPPGTGE